MALFVFIRFIFIVFFCVFFAIDFIDFMDLFVASDVLDFMAAINFFAFIAFIKVLLEVLLKPMLPDPEPVVSASAACSEIGWALRWQVMTMYI